MRHCPRWCGHGRRDHPAADGEVPNECSPCLHGRRGVHRRAHWQDDSKCSDQLRCVARGQTRRRTFVLPADLRDWVEGFPAIEVDLPPSRRQGGLMTCDSLRCDKDVCIPATGTRWPARSGQGYVPKPGSRHQRAATPARLNLPSVRKNRPNDTRYRTRYDQSKIMQQNQSPAKAILRGRALPTKAPLNLLGGYVWSDPTSVDFKVIAKVLRTELPTFRGGCSDARTKAQHPRIADLRFGAGTTCAASRRLKPVHPAAAISRAVATTNCCCHWPDNPNRFSRGLPVSEKPDQFV